MKLSDAIALGYAEIKHSSWTWLRQDERNGDCRGCAVGAALYAVGERHVPTDNTVKLALEKYWPWAANGKFLQGISDRFHRVMGVCDEHERMTIEELIAWVRSIEPAEEPASPAEAEQKDTVRV